LITVMTCEVCGPENVTHVPSAGTQTVNLPKSYWPVIGIPDVRRARSN
jgi:hypothetical protein